MKAQGWLGIKNLFQAIVDSRRGSWDWGIDVRGDVRNAMLLALARARRRVAYDFSGGAALLTDVVPDDGVLRHIIDHHAGIAATLGMEMTADERIPSLISHRDTTPSAPWPAARAVRRVGVHFGASLALRRMPAQEGCDLLARLQEQDQIILVDAPEVRGLNSEVLGRLGTTRSVRVQRWEGSLGDFIQFLQTLDHFYAMDSGPAHLAAAVGVETTVFFGPHLPFAVRPMGSHVSVIERDDLGCRPCDQHRCTNPRYQDCLTQVVRLLKPSDTQIASPMRQGDHHVGAVLSKA